MTIDPENFWDENYYNHPPLTVHMVEKAEQVLGITLPPELLELLYIQNGGYTKEFIYPMAVPTSWAKGYIPLEALFGIVDEEFDTAHNILLTSCMTEEWGLPEKQVLISGGGAYWITLDYRRGVTPTVCWLDVDMEEDIQVAENFKMFLDGLKRGEPGSL